MSCIRDVLEEVMCRGNRWGSGEVGTLWLLLGQEELAFAELEVGGSLLLWGCVELQRWQKLSSSELWMGILGPRDWIRGLCWRDETLSFLKLNDIFSIIKPPQARREEVVGGFEVVMFLEKKKSLQYESVGGCIQSRPYMFSSVQLALGIWELFIYGFNQS